MLRKEGGFQGGRRPLCEKCNKSRNRHPKISILTAAQDRTPTETWNSEDSGPFLSLVTVQDSLPEPVQKNW